MDPVVVHDTEHSEKISVYTYPFTTLPTLISHIHPRYVISNIASLKFTDKADETNTTEKWKTQMGDRGNEVEHIQEIWNWWTTEPPAEFMNSEVKNNDAVAGASADGSKTNGTAPRRKRPREATKKAPEDQGSPKSKKSRQNTCSGGLWLDDQTLHELDQQNRSSSPDHTGKQGYVHTWLTGIVDASGVDDTGGFMLDNNSFMDDDDSSTLEDEELEIDVDAAAEGVEV